MRRGLPSLRPEAEESRLRQWAIVLTSLVLGTGLGHSATPLAPLAAVTGATVAQVVERNARARGGVEAWNKIASMAWMGHVESAEAPGRSIAFLLQQQRPDHTRFELVAQGQRSVRIYNGVGGWKLRPGNAGVPELSPYDADELDFARDGQVIDGPLMDDVARGASLSLFGTELLDGRRNYVVQSKLPSGAVHRIWVDAETFREAQYQRDIRNAAGRVGVATVRYRNYQAFQGLQIPTSIEAGPGNGEPVNRLVIAKVALNPPVDPRAFDKPEVPKARHLGVVVDPRKAPPQAATAAAPAPGTAHP
jgi:hypothetical protein